MVIVAQSAVQSMKCKFHKFKLLYYQMSGRRKRRTHPPHPYTSAQTVGVKPWFFSKIKKYDRKQNKASSNWLNPWVLSSTPHVLSFVYPSVFVVLSVQHESRFQGLPWMDQEWWPNSSNYISQKSLKRTSQFHSHHHSLHLQQSTSNRTHTSLTHFFFQYISSISMKVPQFFSHIAPSVQQINFTDVRKCKKCTNESLCPTRRASVVVWSLFNDSKRHWHNWRVQELIQHAWWKTNGYKEGENLCIVMGIHFPLLSISMSINDKTDIHARQACELTLFSNKKSCQNCKAGRPMKEKHKRRNKKSWKKKPNRKTKTKNKTNPNKKKKTSIPVFAHSTALAVLVCGFVCRPLPHHHHHLPGSMWSCVSEWVSGLDQRGQAGWDEDRAGIGMEKHTVPAQSGIPSP